MSVHHLPAADGAPTKPGIGRIGAVPPPVTLSSGLLLLAVFLLPLQIDTGPVRNLLDSRLALTDVLVALAVCLHPALLAVRRDRAVGLLPVWFILTLAYGLFVVIIRSGGASDHSVQVKLGGAIVLAILAIAIASATRNGHGDRILRWLVTGAILWGILGYIDWKLFDVLPFVSTRIPSRFGGTLVDPNNAGGLYAMMTVLLLGLGPRYFGRPGLTLLATAGSGAALALTYSRGGYLAVVGGGIVALLFLGVNASRTLRVTAVLTIAFTVLVAAGTVQDAIDDFERRPDTVQDRNELASTGLEMFTDSNGLGAGLGAVRTEVDLIVHNTALWLTVEMSFVGLAFFVALAGVPLAVLYRGRSTNPRLAAGLAGAHATMVIASLGIEALYQRYWWVIIGLIAGHTWSGRGERHAAAGAVTTT